jgi:hypothetical protein
VTGWPFLSDSLRMKVEQHIALYVKPAPRWMPRRLYRWLMSRVVLVEDLPELKFGAPGGTTE